MFCFITERTEKGKQSNTDFGFLKLLWKRTRKRFRGTRKTLKQVNAKSVLNTLLNTLGGVYIIPFDYIEIFTVLSQKTSNANDEFQYFRYKDSSRGQVWRSISCPGVSK